MLSLICCTIGRFEPLLRLLASLAAQEDRGFEVILVDQNDDGRLDGVSDGFDALRIKRLRCSPGLSLARNVGLASARGDILGFPDDDCWYGPEVTARVHRAFTMDKALGFLTGRTVDAAGRESVCRHLAASAAITRETVFLAGNSNGLFVRREVAQAVAGFSEELGAGARFGSGEETDFMLRCLARGHRGRYERSLEIFHEAPDARLGGRRVALYAPGYGRVLRRNGFGVAHLARHAVRSAASGLRAGVRGDPALAWERLMWAFGAISGFAAPLDQPSLSRGERSPNTTTAATNTSALGIRFSEHSTRELAHVVAGETIDVGAGPRAIMTANVDHVVQLRRRGRFRDAYGWAWALTADGMPVYLYAKLRGVSILERVTGCALADQVLKKLSPERHRCFFIVGTEALGDALERMLVRHGFSRESVEICVPPFGFEADRAYSNALARRVHAHRTTHLFVALGAPKSEEWAYEQRECIGDCYVLCVGMALDYLVGARRRAPVWMQNGGLEWLWRFAHEPVRLFPRYFVASWGFLAAVRRDLSRS